LVMITSEPTKGLVGIKYSGSLPTDNRRLKILIDKPDASMPLYSYNILSNDLVFYPLQYGNGSYRLRIGQEKTPGANQYAILRNYSVDSKTANPLDVFLQSHEKMPWNRDMEAIKFVAALVKGKTSQRDKVLTIWQHMVTNYKYDYELAGTIKYNYLPDIEDIFGTKKSICYGLTALFNSQLRSLGVPCRMVHGNTKLTPVYHCWSEIWLSGQWITVDITFDIFQNSKSPVKSFERKADGYAPRYFY